MGAKGSSSKCTPATIDYIRKRDVNKLTRQLSRRASSLRSKKLTDNEENNIELLLLDSEHDEQQRSALHFAAIEGDATIIVTLYEYMHTVDVVDKSGRTPLHYAAITNNEETLAALLLCNPNKNRMSHDGTTPLHEAIIHNHAGILTLLVQNNSNLNKFFQDYLPPLILAVCLQHTTIVELLINIGIDPSLIDTHSGRSALHYAAYFHDNTTIFQQLLSSSVHRSIDINARDNDGYSILDYSRANIHGSTAITDLLLQLNVFDPDRGEVSNEQIEIEMPKIKIFRSSRELSSLKKTNAEVKKQKKTKAK